MRGPELFREEMGARVDVRALRALLDLTVPAKPPPGSLPMASGLHFSLAKRY